MDDYSIFNLEAKIFTRIKNETQEELKTKYPTIYYTTSNSNKGDPIYPTVYIHEMQGAEVGADLEGSSLNGVMENLQVEVVTNTSQADARYVMARIIGSLKGMRFTVMSMPEFENGASYYRSICRCRRIIGNGEEL